MCHVIEASFIVGGVGRVCQLRLYPERTVCLGYQEGMPVKASSWLNRVLGYQKGMAVKASSRPILASNVSGWYAG